MNRVQGRLAPTDLRLRFDQYTWPTGRPRRGIAASDPV